MATIEVIGKVQSFFYEGKGMVVTESYKTDSGEMRDTLYKVWLNKPAAVSIGDEVKVRGFVSARLNEFRDDSGQLKQYVDINVNNPLVVLTEPSANMMPTHESAPF